MRLQREQLPGVCDRQLNYADIAVLILLTIKMNFYDSFAFDKDFAKRSYELINMDRGLSIVCGLRLRWAQYTAFIVIPFGLFGLISVYADTEAPMPLKAWTFSSP